MYDIHACIGRQIDRSIDRQIDGWMDGWMDVWIERQKDRQIEKQIDRQIDRWIDRQIDTQIDRQNSNTEFKQKWQIKPKAIPQNCSSRMCRLCLAEEVATAQFDGTELSSNCRRKNDFFLQRTLQNKY